MASTRAVAAGAAFAAALASTVTSAPARAFGDTCESATVFAATAAGVVGDTNRDDWWRVPVAPGRYVVTLLSGAGDADLSVADGACGALCSSAAPIAVDTCMVATTGTWLTIGVWSASKVFPAAYSVAVAPAPGVTACADGIDNDSDGAFDYPADDGCQSDSDSSEEPAVCDDVYGADVCTSFVVADEVMPVVLDQPLAQDRTIAGYLDTYDFSIGRRTVGVLCVVLVARPGVTSNPCKKAGGTFRQREQTLYNHPHDTPRAPIAPSSVVSVCEASLTMTVDSYGLQDVATYALC